MAKSFFQLSRDEVQNANNRYLAWLKDNPNAISVQLLTGPELGAKLGIRLMTEEDTKNGLTPWVTYGGKQYVATKNKSNRPASVPNMRNLLKFFLTGRWALNGETLIFDETGQCCSAQHRGGAAYFYSLDTGDTSTKFPFIVVEGVPVELIDSIDTGKSRDNKDILTRHADIFREKALRTITGMKVTGTAVVNMRKTLSKEANTVCRLLWLRTDAKDVKASSTNYKQEEIFDIMSRFEPSDTLNDRPEGEAFDSQLEDLVQLVYNQDVQTSGKAGTLNKFLGRADIAAAVVLYSNRNTPALPSDTKDRRFALPDSFAVDLEFAQAFCSCANRVDGFMKPFYDKVEKDFQGKSKLEPQYYFAALVKAMKHFADNYTKDVQKTIGENGQEIETVNYNCVPLPTHGIPDSMPTKRSVQDRKRNPWQWPHFGGIDVGYVKPAPKKKDDIAEDDDSEDSDD